MEMEATSDGLLVFPLLNSILSYENLFLSVYCSRSIFSPLLIPFQIQGAIMVSALFQIVIGFTGLVGVLLRFIGPLTIAPTIALVGVALFGVAADHAGKRNV